MLSATTLLALLSLACVTGGQGYATNETIAENEEVGVRLAADIDSLLADPNVPEADKAKIRNEISSGTGRSGNSLHSGKSNGNLEIDCTKSCCKVIVPPLVHQTTSIASYSCTTYYSERYTTGCGLFNWNRCTRHRTKSRRSTCYRTEYQYHSTPRPCPNNKKTCCNGEFWYRNCCLDMCELLKITYSIRGRMSTSR